MAPQTLQKKVDRERELDVLEDNSRKKAGGGGVGTKEPAVS